MEGEWFKITMLYLIVQSAAKYPKLFLQMERGSETKWKWGDIVYFLKI
jgi:hypothetical protein